MYSSRGIGRHPYRSTHDERRDKRGDEKSRDSQSPNDYMDSPYPNVERRRSRSRSRSPSRSRRDKYESSKRREEPHSRLYSRSPEPSPYGSPPRSPTAKFNDPILEKRALVNELTKSLAPLPDSPTYMDEREMRNRSPEYPRMSSAVEPSFGRSRSPDLPKYKKDIDLSAADYGIDKAGQTRSFLNQMPMSSRRDPNPVRANDPSLAYGTVAKMEPYMANKMSDPYAPYAVANAYAMNKVETSSTAHFNPYNTHNPLNTQANVVASMPSFNMNKKMAEAEQAKKLSDAFQNINSIEDLIKMKEAYQNKLTALENVLEKSKMRENEILRNKRRDRDGFKDPMMVENRKLQADVKAKIDDVNRVLVEVDKKFRQLNKMNENVEEISNENAKPSNYEAQILQNSLISTTGISAIQENEEEDEEEEYESSLKYEYYDPGSHWCRDCDKLIPKIKDYFEHLHNKDHWKVIDVENQPWKKVKKTIEDKKLDVTNKTKAPIKGAQFLIPIRGFYCPLCSQFLGDNITAEEHLKSAKHNRIYTRFTFVNIDYEHKWNSDKGKALSRYQLNERKRQREEQKDKEEREKEAKKRKMEEDRKKEKEREKERERDREKFERETKAFRNDNSGERFRLKEVKLDLNKDRKDAFEFSFSKLSTVKSKIKEKPYKRKRDLSPSSSSSSVSSRTNKFIYDQHFIDNDKKLKDRPIVMLKPLTTKIARKYNCDELVKVLEESKLKPKNEEKSIKIEADFGIMNEEFVNNDLQSSINDIVNNIDVDDDKETDNSPNNDMVDSVVQIKSETCDKDAINSETKNDNNIELIATDCSELVIDETEVTVKCDETVNELVSKEAIVDSNDAIVSNPLSAEVENSV